MDDLEILRQSIKDAGKPPPFVVPDTQIDLLIDMLRKEKMLELLKTVEEFKKTKAKADEK